MLITGLSNDREHGGRTRMVEDTNDVRSGGLNEGNYLATYDADRRGARARSNPAGTQTVTATMCAPYLAAT